MGSPIATSMAVPIRLRTSWKINDRRSAGLKWLAIWNRRLFWPSKQIGTTVARARWINWAVNGCQGPSMARLRPKRSGAVEIPPAGNTTTQPPASRCCRAAARDATLVRVASSVPAKSTGST